MVIVLDANVILRALTISEDPRVLRNNDLAATLFRQVGRGEVDVTASDAVLAEVAFILTARNHYHVPATETAAKLAALVSWPGFKMPDKRSIVRALDLWAAHPRLDFVDALVAAQAERPGMKLATFDSDSTGLPGIDHWQFGEPE